MKIIDLIDDEELDRSAMRAIVGGSAVADGVRDYPTGFFSGEMTQQTESLYTLAGVVAAIEQGPPDILAAR